MRRRLFILGSFLTLMLLPTAGAADLSGKWKGDLKGPDGNALEINFDFKVDGEKLTGTVTNTYGEEQITEGVVKGDEISFIIMAGGGQFKITYKGKVDGEDIKFPRHHRRDGRRRYGREAGELTGAARGDFSSLKLPHPPPSTEPRTERAVKRKTRTRLSCVA